MEINIPFDHTWTNVAISLSGGADSALLAYMICDKSQEDMSDGFTVHCISHTRMWKTKPWQEHDSLRIFNWLKEEFPRIIFKRHVNFIPPELEWGDKGRTITDEYGKLVSGDTLELRAYAEYVCSHNSVSVYYNGVTRNPRNVDFAGMPTRDIDPTDDNKHLEIMLHMGIIASHPFRFADKAWVVLQYKNLDIMELFDLTRSCEGEFSNMNYKTYTPGQFVPICGTCFWCKEREWAIEQTK